MTYTTSNIYCEPDRGREGDPCKLCGRTGHGVTDGLYGYVNASPCPAKVNKRVVNHG